MSLKDVICALAAHGSPLAARAKALACADDWLGLQSLKVDPLAYRDSESLWRDVLIVELCRKMQLPGSAVARREAAVATFLSCEAQNAVTNRRLKRLIGNYDLDPIEAFHILPIVEEWRAEISRILGPLPRDLTPTFSGGATLLNRHNKTCLPDKIESAPAIYKKTECLNPLAFQTRWWRAHDRYYVYRYNVFFTVPKDGTKDRGCCKEAGGALSYQLALMQEMLPLLAAVGWDLKRNKPLHERLAREASEHGLLATEDMSNASDLLARELPRLVLPSMWFDLFDSLRAPCTMVDGKVYYLEKFSSMGNGFTFPLETLLFGSLARVLTRRLGGDPDTVRVYGDDIICLAFVSPHLRAALRYFGFTPNAAKSFNSGPFRESCGGDFFLGCSVRGHNLEEFPVEPQQWMSLANGLMRSACRAPSGAHRRSRLDWIRDAHRIVLAAIPSEIRRCRGPAHLGDAVIHDAPDKWVTSDRKRSDRSHDQVWVRAYVPVTRVLALSHWPAWVQWAAIGLPLSSDGVSPRNNVTGYKLGWLPLRGLPELTLKQSYRPSWPFIRDARTGRVRRRLEGEPM